jgi:cell division transport system permease protein
MALKLDYVTRETFGNLRRNLLLTTASMVTVAVSLSMVGIAFFVRYGVDNATARWKNGIEFEVFMSTDATAQQKAAVESELESNPQVRTVKYINRAEQFRLFRQYFADQPETLNAVQEDDMPESYRVAPKVKDSAIIQGVADAVESNAGVDQVAFAKDQIDEALETSRAMQVGVVVVATVLFLASSLLIFNTIRMAIFARRREIEVMKLVGATNWFIRVPFMVEGLAQGVLGAVAAFAALYALRLPMQNWIVDKFEEFGGFFVGSGDVLLIGGVVVVVGSLVGAASAGVAVTRFLDV